MKREQTHEIIDDDNLIYLIGILFFLFQIYFYMNRSLC